MIFLKLGGSLITDKTQAESPQLSMIAQLADEIRAYQQAKPASQLLLGHGSGSFGHYEASKYNTQAGVSTREQWMGFARVWQSAQRLNRLMIDELSARDLPVITFSPASSAFCRGGDLIEMSTQGIRRALEVGLVPVLHGDVAFDSLQGGTIVSTEQVFTYLAGELQPTRILLAGREPGVLAEPNDPGSVLDIVRADDVKHVHFGGIHGDDVTGGMAAKVHEALRMAKACPQADIYIFSPQDPGDLHRALQGGHPGTRISSS